MVKRIAVLAIVLAAFLIVAVPAFAANGYRANYTVSGACQVCHQSGQPFDAPKVYNDWVQTKHGTDDLGKTEPGQLPYGSVCLGCHEANYAPGKVTPVPVSTDAGVVSWGASPSATTSPQALGNAPFSENDIGCSSCHYGADVNGVLAEAGTDPNDTAHTAAYAKLANADICGACHSRYAYTTKTFAVNPIPTPTAVQTTLIQPQMAIGYPMLTATGAPVPLASYLNIPSPGWSPTPDPAATSASGLQTYWTYNGVPTLWQTTGHEGSAAQYPEWLSDPAGHATSLSVLKAEVGPNPPQSCLECHSADYRIAVEAGKTPPTGAQAQYGITCVGCHTPHKAGTAKGAWDSEFDAQLVGNPTNSSDLCTTCHNGEIGNGAATPGATMHHVTKEDMNGTGGIGVAQGLPGVHKGKCVECHMPPTSYGRGSAQLGGNHTFKIITPAVSVGVTPVKGNVMPFSACSTCHNRPGDSNAVWLQDTIDQRQAAMHSLYDQVGLALQSAGMRMGYTSPPAGTVPGGGSSTDPDDVASYDNWLNGVLNTKGSSAWSADELLWQKAFTNWTYIPAEGSWGIHNWQYDSLVIDAALNQANQVNKTAQDLTLKLSKTSVKKNKKVTFSGTVTPASAGTVQIQKKKNGVFSSWKTATLSGGSYSITVKMTKKGTFYYRAFLPANPSYAGDTTAQVKLVVKKK